MVLTKDLSYSYITLMPRDKREASIYYQSKLVEVSELYPYYLAIYGFGILVFAVPTYYVKRDLFTFLIMFVNLIWFLIRLTAYCLRKRN